MKLKELMLYLVLRKNLKNYFGVFCITLKKKIGNCLIITGCEITNLFCLFLVCFFFSVLMMQDATYFCCFKVQCA